MNKKVLLTVILALAIGTTAFGIGPGKKGHSHGKAMRGHVVHSRTYRAPNPEIERVSIAIEEKMLEIRKELIREVPDWNNIERLNIEIATEKAKFKTQMMRRRYDQANAHSENRQAVANNQLPTPQIAEPQAVQPQETQPQAVQPQVVQPQVVQPQTTQSEAVQPQGTTQPQVTQP